MNEANTLYCIDMEEPRIQGQQVSTSRKQNVDDPIKNNEPDGNAGALAWKGKLQTRKKMKK